MMIIITNINTDVNNDKKQWLIMMIIITNINTGVNNDKKQWLIMIDNK